MFTEKELQKLKRFDARIDRQKIVFTELELEWIESNELLAQYFKSDCVDFEIFRERYFRRKELNKKYNQKYKNKCMDNGNNASKTTNENLK